MLNIRLAHLLSSAIAAMDMSYIRRTLSVCCRYLSRSGMSQSVFLLAEARLVILRGVFQPIVD